VRLNPRRITTEPPVPTRPRHSTKSVPIPRKSILPVLFRLLLSFARTSHSGRNTSDCTSHITQSLIQLSNNPSVLLQVPNPVSAPKILILHVRAHSSPRTPMLCSDARVQSLIGSGKQYSQHHIDPHIHSPSTYVVHSKSHNLYSSSSRPRINELSIYCEEAKLLSIPNPLKRTHKNVINISISSRQESQRPLTTISDSEIQQKCHGNLSHYYCRNWWRSGGRERACQTQRWTFLHRTATARILLPQKFLHRLLLRSPLEDT
jgi:hypothetical protein